MADEITIEIDGLELFGRNLDAYVQNLRVEVNDRTQEAGINTQAGAKQNAPVDTGRLRSSIQYTPDNHLPDQMGCTVGTNVDYAAAVELGHRTRNPDAHVSARPYLYPAFAKEEQQFVADLKKMVGQ